MTNPPSPKSLFGGHLGRILASPKRAHLHLVCLLLAQNPRLDAEATRSIATGNPSPQVLEDLLRTSRTIAVVGISRDPAKAARRVPSYLAVRGYDVIPVNPNPGRILGRAARPTLEDVAEPVDIVLLFRPSAEVGPFVAAAAERPERPAIWLQEGIRDEAAAAAARAKGLTVIQDLCIYKVHRALEWDLRHRATPDT